MKYFPPLFLAVLITILAYGERYVEILIAFLFASFVKIVINSKKYPKLNQIFDRIF